MLQANITVSNNTDWVQAFQWTDSGILPPTLQAGGAGYVTPPGVVCSPPVDANGLQIPGGHPALITATVSGGAVNTLTLADPGAGYVAGYPPTISFVASDDGDGAAAFTTVGNPITLAGSALTMNVRPKASSSQLLVVVGSAAPKTGITITDAANGKFQIALPKASLQLLIPGQTYVHDLVRLRADGFTERLWAGTLSVTGGVTR